MQDVIESGEHKIEVEGNRIVTFYDLKHHYKIMGCGREPEYYRFKSYTTKDGDTLKQMIIKKYGYEYLQFIVMEAKSWKIMSKKEKTIALNQLLTDINYSMTTNQKVLKRVAEITGDIDMLKSINYHKNIKEIGL